MRKTHEEENQAGEGLSFGGRPPFAPLARAAAAFASLVRPLLACPPLRPNATAAGSLRGTALSAHVGVNVFLRQRLHAFHRQVRNFAREALKFCVVLRGECGVAAGHQVAACGVHGEIIPKALWVVK